MLQVPTLIKIKGQGYIAFIVQRYDVTLTFRYDFDLFEVPGYVLGSRSATFTRY